MIDASVFGKVDIRSIDVRDRLSDGIQNVSLIIVQCMRGMMKNFG